MRDELLLVHKQLEQCPVGVDVRVFYPLVEPAVSYIRGTITSLGLIHHDDLIRILNLLEFLDRNATFAHDIEVLARQQDFVLPRL
jgi:hypothetical protein